MEVRLANGKTCRIHQLGLAHRRDSSAKTLIVRYVSDVDPGDVANLEREAREVFEPARVTCEAWGILDADLDAVPLGSKTRTATHPFFRFHREPNGTWGFTRGTSTS